MANKNPEVHFKDDRTVLFNSGQILKGVHLKEHCLGDVCAIHNPSNHDLRGQLLSFNGRHMVRNVDGDLFIDPDDYFYLKTGYAILRNSAKCALCSDEIQSNHRHDFNTCSCGAIYVDGGLDYIRQGANNFDELIDTSVVVGTP